MKRVVAVLCVLAAVALLLLLPFAGDRGAAPGPAPARTAGPAAPPAPADSPVATAPPPKAAAPSPAATPADATAEGGIKAWAPHGQVVDRSTGEPIFWTGLTYEIRFRIGEESPCSWSEERDPPADGDEPLKDPGAFDLGGQVRQSPMEPHATPERVADAEFRVRARARGFAKAATDWVRWADFPRDRVLLVEMDVASPSSLLARVRTGEGAPYRGRASLSIRDEGEFQSTDPVEADAEGMLLFEGLPPGTFGISVEPQGPRDTTVFHVPGHGSAAKEIHLPAGGRAEAEFVLARVGEIAVDIAAADGSAVEAWVLDYKFKQGSGSSGASPRRLTGCPPGEYEVKVWSKGFLEWATTVRVDAGATARVEARLERAPWADFLLRVPDEVYARLDRTAADLARMDSLVAARSAIIQATRDEIWDQLTTASGFADRGPEVRAEIEDAWKNRTKGPARTTSYGSGTFVVVAGAGKADAEGEEWWRGAAADERKEWLLSWCAEKGGYLEVVRILDDPVPAGQGAGMIRSVRWR